MAAADSDAGASAGSRKRPFTWHARLQAAEEELDPKFDSSLGPRFLSLYKVVVRTEPWCTTYHHSRPESEVVQLELEFAYKLQNDAVRALGTAISAKIDMYGAWKRLTVSAYGSEEKLEMVAKCMECVEDFTTMLLDLQKIKHLLLIRHQHLLMNLLTSFDTNE